MIQIEGLSKRYGGRLALHPTTLKVQREECLAVIGPSASGKSTLLRLLLGLIEPDTGRVTVSGVPLTARTRRSLRLRMGYLTQGGGLFPHLTAERNVTLVARCLRWDGGRVRRRLEELAELTQLSAELLGRYPAQLSGGQRQRVALMRALMLDPEVLLLDEPLGALDPFIRRQVQRDLKRIFERLRKTVVLITHDMGEAAYLGRRIAFLRDGRLLQVGGLRDLLDAPQDPFVTEFIGAQRQLWGGEAGTAS